LSLKLRLLSTKNPLMHRMNGFESYTYSISVNIISYIEF